MLNRNEVKTMLHAAIIAVGAALLLLLAVDPDKAFAEGRQLLAAVIQVDNSPIVQALTNNTSTPELLKKVDEAKKLLAVVEPKVGSVDIRYTEERVAIGSNGKVSVSHKKMSDPELEIPLALLETATGKIQIVTVIHRGNEIISPDKYPISIVQRANGIRWNWWNTEYLPPRGYVVLANKYPEVGYHDVVVGYKTVRGKQKAVTENRPYLAGSFAYAPYSEGLHTPEMVQAGREYLQKLAWDARETLRDRGVKSQAFPGSAIADVGQLQLEFFEHLPIIEQSDMTEFTLNPRRTAERVLIRIAANGSDAFTHTGNSAGAYGLMQFTDNGKGGTYSAMRRLYPEAKLPASFRVGAGTDLTAMMAAMLLHDNNLKDLINKFGSNIAESAQLEEYLAAAYNGAPRHTHSSLTAFFTLVCLTGFLDKVFEKKRKAT
ncbi:MAG: hypothetical protein KW806_00835 [Candidatus Yanofskybacteria bacterium]|nr:hypothetical protein [Candidatus Yanofskybacteria bacterium]